MKWPKVALGELFDIARGGSPRPIEKFLTNDPDGLNWISISDATKSGKIIERTERRIRPAGLSKTRWVEPGDFLLSNSMSFGRPYIMGTTGCIHDGWLVLKPRKTVVDSDYLYHLLSSEAVYAQFAKRATGTTVRNLNTQIVSETEIPLPPLPEQQRIAAILDQADALRRLRRLVLERLQGVEAALFEEMFGDVVTNSKGWKEKKLGDLCSVGSSKRVFVSEFVEYGVPFYRGTEVGKLGAGGAITPELFITFNHYERLLADSGTPQIGDLLLPSICSDGRIWKIDHNDPFYFKDGRVLWIKSSISDLYPDYLRYYLKILFARNYHQIASGTTFAELKIVNLKNVDILCPPAEMQGEFSSKVEIIQKHRANIDLENEHLDALFASLQHRAFRGEL